MLPSLLVAAAVTAPAAPVPPDALPNTTGPAPRVLAVKADAGGTVWVTGQVYEKRKVQQAVAVIENGKQVVKQQEREVMTSNYIRKTLADFGGKFTSADGDPLSTEQATKRVRDGAVILISADGKPVDKAWLKAVREDTVVMLAEGLGAIQFQYGAAPLPSTPDPRLVMLCPNDEGAVRLAVNPNGLNGAGNQVYYDDLGGARIIRGQVAVINGGIVEAGLLPADGQAARPAGGDGKKAIEEVKFDAYDISGKLIPRADALKQLKAGGLVLIAGDNRFPDAEYLKAFHDDLIVLVSAELAFPPGMPNPYDSPAKADAPAAKPAAQPAPPAAVPVPAIRINPAVIKRVAPPPAP
jgi:hypothetical protein